MNGGRHELTQFIIFDFSHLLTFCYPFVLCLVIVSSIKLFVLIVEYGGVEIRIGSATSEVEIWKADIEC